MKCVHCGAEVARLRPRGICWRCYDDKSIRALYPPVKPVRLPQTMAELDALVEEQSRPENLPAWWFRCSGRPESVNGVVLT